MHRRSLLLPLLVLLAPPLVGCDPRPRILAPADGIVVAAGAPVSVNVDLGTSLPPNGRVVVKLLRGVDSGTPQIDDVSALVPAAPGSAFASGALPAVQLGSGRNTLTVQVDRDGDGRAELTTSSTFEPVDFGALDRCDPIDPGHCLLPFPNDFFTRSDASADTGRRVNLVRASMPVNQVGVRVDPTEWNRNDGFSPGSKIVALVQGVDLALTGAAPITDMERSLDTDAPIVLLDATTGARHPMWVELDANTSKPAKKALILRPAKNLTDGHRYIVAMRGLRDASGALLPAGRAFRVFRDAQPTNVPEIEARRPAMESVLATLQAAGIDRSGLYLAWDFTVASTRNLTERMLHIRDDAFASLQGGVPSFNVTSVENLTPAQDSRIARRVRGTFSVPLYLTNGGVPGSRFRNANDQPLTDPEELPVRGGSFTASFVCNVSRTTTQGGDPVVPARASVYGHGLLGSADEINAGNVKDMSVEHNFMFCATPWYGMAAEDQPIAVSIVTDFSQFPQLADRVQHGMLAIQFLARLLKDPRGFATHAAFQAGAASTPVFVPGEVFYDGNSQGGIIGGAATAVSTEWTRAVLGVPGMNYSTLLRRSKDFAPFSFIMNLWYLDELERTIALSLIQMLWDRAEANGYANHMTDQPLPGTPAHRVLLHVGFGDHQVADVTAEIEARTIGAHIHQPAINPGRHTAVNPYWGIPAVPSSPFDGSAIVIWDTNKTPASPLTNTPPQLGTDPHEAPRRDVRARQQKSAFLQTNGAFIDVCNGAPCVIP